MRTILIFIAIVFAELFIMSLMPLESVKSIIEEETNHTKTWFGEQKTNSMLKDASNLFTLLFISTGAVQGSNDFFLKHRKKRYNKGWQQVSDAKIFDMLASAMEKIWLVIKSGMLRLQIMWVCLLLGMSFILPALIDGLAIRQIQKWGESNVSPNLYSYFNVIFISCFAVPFILLFWPMAITPIYMLAWTVILAGSLWVISSNWQHGG
ncbi:DUF4400 domain-containing protein [Thalassotalea piscium]|uniref:DUF4400 domain-containing protein n=1 Tax=Thalassotalea piscium TaxID=1230533 RepID=A0A7X0NKI9_9GAMM|nr:DUF4400 domain-containing protein [Thalassotalea piscium]MBB6545134.1 hypothetical protein [Thalassotalea piscium]